MAKNRRPDAHRGRSGRKGRRTQKKASVNRGRRVAKGTGKRASPRLPKLPTAAYKTRRGSMYRGTLEDFLASKLARRYQGKVQLVFTSPPFPLNHKKRSAPLIVLGMGRQDRNETLPAHPQGTRGLR